MKHITAIGGAAFAVLLPLAAAAQPAPVLNALKGLAPVAVLPATPEGRAALASNLAVTGGIQNGVIRQPTLMPFPEQQRHALKDAFITGWNAAELADALGSRLGPAYGAVAHYDDLRSYTSLSPAVAHLIAYTNETTAADSNAGKYFFANMTTDGKAPVTDAAAAILKANGGVTDVFGRAYGRPAGSPGTDAFGNSRPFQTEPGVTLFEGVDYFGKPTNNTVHLSGPAQNLVDSPSYPSGHTTYGTMESLLLGLLVPERYPQQIVRAAEYGNNRIVLGAHYAMDVIGGRALAMHDVAHLLANDPGYLNRTFANSAPIGDYRAALKAARADAVATLEAGCGGTIAACARDDTSRFADPAANAAFVEATLTYAMPVVYPRMAGTVEDVATVAPEAGHLLTAAYPALTLKEANDILTATEGPGGGFLNDGSAFGLYSRLNLYAAAVKAAELAASKGN